MMVQQRITRCFLQNGIFNNCDHSMLCIHFNAVCGLKCLPLCSAVLTCALSMFQKKTVFLAAEPQMKSIISSSKLFSSFLKIFYMLGIEHEHFGSPVQP